METNRTVCWFSCGAASAVAAKLIIASGRQNVVVVRCAVEEEHPDNDRFTKDCERWLETPIIVLKNGKYDGSVFKVMESFKYVSNKHGAPCTRELKKALRLAYGKPGDIHVFGYCAGEEKRYDRFLDANNISSEAPLIEAGIDHANALGVIERAGIDLPVMYKLGYKHNNCIGCAKASGAGYWNKIRRDFPEQFEKWAEVSERLGARMTRYKDKGRIFLRELPPEYGSYKEEPEIQCGVFCEAVDDTHTRHRDQLRP